MDTPFCFSFKQLKQTVESCTLCPRLVKYRQNVPPSPSHKDEPHWRRPVPGFGDAKARVLILGLAPSPTGGNRTGRPFTGDLSGKFLFSALQKEGFANQSYGESADDGLELIDCYLTAAVKCTPPQHKPLKSEFYNCSGYFENEFFLLKQVKAVVTLGKHAFDTYLNFLKKEANLKSPFPKFSHGAKCMLTGWPTLYASYHPSPRNTNTGLLNEKMFLDILRQIKKETL
jgi:uracil-DNA glycosylase family 4